MSNQVSVIDNISGTVLFQTSMDKISEAYAFATMMENEGLDIQIIAPGLTETLIKSLGADESELTEYKKSINRELEHHIDDSGCATCAPTKT